MRKIITAFMMLLCAACMASAANYLTFTAEEDGSTFGIVNIYNNPDVQYSLDGGNTWNALTEGDTVMLVHVGDKALLKGNNPNRFSSQEDAFTRFVMTGKIAASGSVMSLIDGVGISTEVPGNNCFYRLFQGCTSLTQAPELPATTLAVGCYSEMFSGCTSLTQAPALPATTLTDSCYMYMFSGCTGLSEIHVSFDDWLDGNNSTAYWVRNVARTGTFICPKDLPAEYGESRIPTGWTAQYVDDTVAIHDTVAGEANYLTFTAEEDSSSFGIVNNGGNNPDVQYSLDGGKTWTTLAGGDTVVLAHKGDKALLRGGNSRIFSKGLSQYSSFTMTGKVAASGSVMSLIDRTGLSTEIPGNYCFYSLFAGCTGMTQAPELPATTLTENCYRNMFSGCTGLTQTPELPATTLADYCYLSMFSDCMGLTQAPELPATTLAEACYVAMFSDCTNLTQAPELPSTTLAQRCYESMFSGCTSLTLAPELPATNLAFGCYSHMFLGCTSLAQTPKLPATTLVASCYQSMFSDCVSLTSADLSFEQYVGERSCCNDMFRGCTNLTEIKVSFEEWGDGNLENPRWVENVAPTGTFICPKALALEYGVSRIPEGWTVKYIEDMANYLTFTAEEDSSTFGIVNNGGNNPDIQYSLDGGETWTALAAGDTITLAHKGDKALLRGNNPEGFSKDWRQCSAFKMTGKVAASGSVMSLIDGTGLSTEIPGNYCFYSLFSGCTGLTQTPELPAMTLANYCYGYMFEGCTSLTQAPKLPATTLAVGCYSFMFSGCTSLTQAPELPATTLAEDCYSFMFSGCTGLAQAPELPATTLADFCYNGIFVGCESLSQIRVSFDEWSDVFTGDWAVRVAPTGTFICPKALPLEYGEGRIPEGWTVKFIDDTVAADTNYLTFTAEEDGSTFGIVNKVESYPEVTCSPDIWYSTDGGYSWNELKQGDTIPLKKGKKALLKGVNPKGVSIGRSEDILYGITYVSFVMSGKIAASGNVMSLVDGEGKTTQIPANYCFYGLFSGCESLTQAPVLPATMLTEYCYGEMFAGCTGLTEAPELPATDMKRGCYASMFSGCNLTQAPKLPALNLAPSCYGYMFSWNKMLTQAPELPATTLAERCYEGMFSGCTSLSEIKVSFDDWNDGDYTAEWVIDVAPTGTFICPKALALEYGEDRIPEGWTVKYIEDLANYLTFTAEEDGSSFGIVNNGGNNPDVQYSLDGGKTWNALAGGDTVILIHKGDMALLKGVNPQGFSKSRNQYSTFKMTGKVAASGSVMSLIDGMGLSTEIPNGYCFCRLFRNCASLTQAPELPATTLTNYCYDAMFLGCTSLTKVPELPATTLADFCYDGMFAGCTSLTQTPELPVTTLVSGCYYSMFSDCTGLTQAPALPATTLADSCYMYMFSGCTGLSEIHVSFDDWLDGNNSTAYWARNVAPSGTFICPENLPLVYGANRIPLGWRVKKVIDGDTVGVPVNYNYLTFTAEEDGSSFGIVNNGDNNPDVQYSLDGGETWTALAEGDTIILAHKGDHALLSGDNPEGFSRSWDQFSTFTMTGKVAASGSVMSLIDGIGLSTASLIPNCLKSLFKDCASLTQAPELPSTDIDRNCYESMFAGCTSLTKAPALPATFLAGSCYRNLFSGCTNLSEINVSFTSWLGTDEWVKDVAPTGTFICPKALPLEYGTSRIPEGWTVKYIEDLANYLTFTAEEDSSSFGIVNKDNNPDVQYSLDGGETWTTLTQGDTVILAHKGDKALLKGNNPEGFSKGWRQYSSFKMTGKVAASGSVMSLIDGLGLSTKIPSDFCFYKLFYNCTSLTQAPALPATTLADFCYHDMFEGCTGLTQAPKLPATTLAEGCYSSMFSGCISLTQAPELPATTLPTASNVEYGCYYGMFEGCTSLTQAPELPATTLTEGCYTDMFYGCTSLTQAPALPATTLAEGCYLGMFSNCTSLTQAPALPATTLAGHCYANMFRSCTSLTQAPELPATTLTDYCYDWMFFGCTSLSKINVSFATWSDYYSSTDGWVKDVAPTGTFICPKDLPLEYGVSRIPEGWTVKYAEGGSGVSSALAEGVTVWTDDLTVYVCGAEGEVSLYDMWGKRVAVSNSTDEERALCVPAKGAYVVRTSGGEKSVLVR